MRLKTWQIKYIQEIYILGISFRYGLYWTEEKTSIIFNICRYANALIIIRVIILNINIDAN